MCVVAPLIFPQEEKATLVTEKSGSLSLPWKHVGWFLVILDEGIGELLLESINKRETRANKKLLSQYS